MAESPESSEPARPQAGGPCKATGEMPNPSEERYRAILQAAMDGFWMADTRGRLLDVNATYCRMSGYSEPELLAMCIADLEAAETREDVARHLQQTMALGEVRFETRHRRKDGSIFDVEVSSQYRSAEGGRVVSFLRDITERKQTEAKLREGEQLLHHLTDNLPNAMVYQVIAEPDGGRRFTFVSRAVERLNEVTVEQALADAGIIYRQVLPEYIDLVRQREEQALKYLTNFRAEVQIRLPSGRLRWLEIASTPRYQADGRLVWDGVEVDITERKQAEQYLRESEEKYRSLVQKIQAAVIVHGPDTRILTCNSMAMDLLGMTEDQILGKAAVEAVFNIFREDGTLLRVEDFPVNQVIAKRQALRNQILRVHYPDKKLKKDIWVLVNADPVFSNEEELFQVIVTFVDITARKQAEEELQKLASVVRKSSELVNLAALDGSMTFLNEAGAKMLGIDMDKVNQANIMRVIPDHLISKFETEIIPALKDQGKWEGELQYRNLKTGELRDVYATTFTLNDPNTGVPLYLANVSLDITERKRAEREKADLEARLQQSQKLESVGRLAGGVAHDFNNMLGVILGYAELAMGKVNPSQPLYTDLEHIRMAAERSAKVTRQLLAFARKQTVAPKVLDLNATVASMHKMLERIIGEQIQLDWQPAADLWPVKVDPAQIDQILANLCLNARDAIGGAGKITIATGNSILDAAYCGTHPGVVPGEYVRLGVSDNGSGMDSETLAHIFEPFFTTKGVGEGTGLGLAMVYGAAQQNNGFVTAESELGKGTTFAIYLPRYMGPSGRVQVEAAPGVVLGGQETILLVEDEPVVLALTATMLENLGYTVLAANTPDRAVALARVHGAKLHLLVTDVIMPGMNGRDLWRQLSALRPDLKCVYMSGYPSNAIAHHGVLEANAHFIQKPFGNNELAAKVRAALDGK